MKRTITSVAIALTAVVLVSACGPNQRILQSANENSSAAAASDPVVVNSNGAPAPTTLEQDLTAMRTADFKFIVVFRRKDGAVLDADDKRYLSEVIPSEINRRRLSDSGRAVIIGSNFRLPPESTKTLGERFAVEDHSKPDPESGGDN
jgi:hypothetical protein